MYTALFAESGRLTGTEETMSDNTSGTIYGALSIRGKFESKRCLFSRQPDQAHGIEELTSH